jgi:putative aldouronate transport system substrate-binding protein
VKQVSESCVGVDYKWIKEGGRFIPTVFSKNSLSSLQLLRRFYETGLIDNDIPYISGTSAYDKFVNGKFAALLTCNGSLAIDEMYQSKWKKRYPGDTTFYDKVKFLKPLLGADGKRYHAIFHTYWSESYLASDMTTE